MRLAIRLNRITTLALTLLGIRPSRCWIEIDGTQLRARMGYLADITVPLSSVLSAAPRSWPFWYGLGIRWYGRGSWGLVGTTRNVVELTFQRAQRGRFVMPSSVGRLAVSVDDPDQLIRLVTTASGNPDRHATPA